MSDTSEVDYTSVRFPTRTTKPDLTTYSRGAANVPMVMGTMGFSEYRPGQDRIITSVMCGRDVIGILPTSVGKCFAPGTRVLMFDGSVRKVEDVRVGDLVMGPDRRARAVRHTHHGIDQMYSVIQEVGDVYVVNSTHTLVMVEEFEDMSCAPRREMSATEYMALPAYVRGRLRGLRAEAEGTYRYTRLRVESAGLGDYFGFEVDGTDSLFLLADFTVVHNSACFIIPTMALGAKTLVYSPLVALMRDQVQKLNSWRFPAAEMSSARTDAENFEAASLWMSGKLNFLYVAPERRRDQRFIDAIAAVKPDIVVVDEAHVISEWSDDFRPDYCRVGDAIREMRPWVVIALTATCTPDIEADIRRVLCMGTAVKVSAFVPRPNLLLHSDDICDDVTAVDYMMEHVGNGSGLMYCSSIKRVQEMASLAKSISGQDVGIFYGPLTPNQKRDQQDGFMSGRTKLMFATNAFGMGIDKGDIRVLVHRSIPGSLESLMQEIGRAGRDWRDAHCMTYFDEAGLRTQNFFLQNKHPSEQGIRRVYAALCAMRQTDGFVRSTYKAISERSGVRDSELNAILRNMVSALVIERERVQEKMHTVAYLGPEPEHGSDASYLRFHEIKTIVRRLGVLNPAGALVVENDALVSEIDVSIDTARKYLKQWAVAGYLAYIPPPTETEIRVVGGLDRVDFGRLKVRADQARGRLDMVVDYCTRVPNNRKHEYMRVHFQNAE